MKLKSLALRGFKSFPDATEIAFHDGLTAVVGPNGCGKSNIGDAVRWALGEQRPTAIRGAKMEEAIFQGTLARRAMNRGSVQLVVSNEDGVLPIPFREVEISRTVFRDGGSEYRLNRAACRLRDVVDLCRDTGLGANAYSVIEIRMIDAILSERTDERRALFEEAAGIGKYKDRRRSAGRRLDASEADLRRIEDVIAEVRTKVRSLARQKGKAQRRRELESRRRSVEATVARHDLEHLDGRLREIERTLESDRGEAAARTARLAAAEASLERLRVERLEAEKGRAELAARMGEISDETTGVERDVAVADERIANGRKRLARIAEEREAAAQALARLEAERLELDRERERCDVDLARGEAELAARREGASEASERLAGARARVEEIETRHRRLARRLARVEGDRDGARQQADELERHLARLAEDSRRGSAAEREARAQGDLFASRSEELDREAEKADGDLEKERARLAAVAERLPRARDRDRASAARVANLEASAEATARIKDSGEEANRLAREAARALPESVRGRLVDSVEVRGADPRAVDDALGRYAGALVVGDARDVERVEAWYRSGPPRRAPLALLPLDAAPRAPGPLPEGVGAVGVGAPWVRAALGGSTLAGDRSWRDARGAVHLIADEGDAGQLEQADRLAALDRELAQARVERHGARRELDALERERETCERGVADASERVLAARDAARAGRARQVAQTDRGERLARDGEELERRLEGTRAARERTLRRLEEAEREGVRLRELEKDAKARLEDARAAHSAAQSEWERVRQAESSAALAAARLEAERDRLVERLAAGRAASERATKQRAALAGEREALEREVAESGRRREEGRRALDRLLSKRDAIRLELGGRDRALDDAASAVREREGEIRELGALERTATDGRHRLELERQSLRDRAKRIAERLERDWGRPVEELVAEAEPATGDVEALRAEGARVVERLAKIGPVNMLAVEEHAEESERLDFLVGQQEDLVKARADLRAAVKRIDAAASKRFKESFEAIRENFRATFRTLFQGGEADLSLTDPDDPLESPVEIRAAPGGKRARRIDLLSGGERALTALSLLFGIYLVKPSPFCVLDEVDAPLDEANVSRFIRMLQGFKAQTQFVVITHNPRTIEAADWVYGVTMEEPGVSSIVGVRLDGRTETPATAEPAA